MNELTRRAFLEASALLFGTAALPGCFEARPPEILVELREIEGLAPLGRSYLAMAPEEGDRERLYALVFPQGEARDLRARIRDEYASGGVVVLSGWTVSRTEARLYALAALGAEGS